MDGSVGGALRASRDGDGRAGDRDRTAAAEQRVVADLGTAQGQRVHGGNGLCANRSTSQRRVAGGHRDVIAADLVGNCQDAGGRGGSGIVRTRAREIHRELIHGQCARQICDAVVGCQEAAGACGSARRDRVPCNIIRAVDAAVGAQRHAGHLFRPGQAPTGHGEVGRAQHQRRAVGRAARIGRNRQVEVGDGHRAAAAEQRVVGCLCATQGQRVHGGNRVCADCGTRQRRAAGSQRDIITAHLVDHRQDAGGGGRGGVVCARAGESRRTRVDGQTICGIRNIVVCRQETTGACGTAGRNDVVSGAVRAIGAAIGGQRHAGNQVRADHGAGHGEVRGAQHQR